MAGSVRRVAGWLFLLLALLAGESRASAASDVAILLLDSAGLDPRMAETLVESFQVSFSKASTLSVVSQSDLAATVGFEKTRQLAGCDNGSCLAELGGALGVKHLVTVRFSKVGASFLVVVKLIDANAANVVASDQEVVQGTDERNLLGAVQRLASRFGKAVGIQLGRVANWPSADGAAAAEPPVPVVAPEPPPPQANAATPHDDKGGEDEDEDAPHHRKAHRKKHATHSSGEPGKGWLYSAVANAVGAGGLLGSCLLGGICGAVGGLGGAVGTGYVEDGIIYAACCASPFALLGCISLGSLLVGVPTTGILFATRGGGDVEDAHGGGDED